jgi:hypothetical protein
MTARPPAPLSRWTETDKQLPPERTQVIAICDSDIGHVTELVYHTANGTFYCRTPIRRVLKWALLPAA